MLGLAVRKLHGFAYRSLLDRQSGVSYTNYVYSEQLSEGNWVKTSGGSRNPEIDLGPCEGEVWIL